MLINASTGITNGQLVPQIRGDFIQPLQVGPIIQGVPASQKQSPGGMADDKSVHGWESVYVGGHGRPTHLIPSALKSPEALQSQLSWFGRLMQKVRSLGACPGGVKCPNCGICNPEGATVCGSCGARL